jgi:hypothetical protein
MDENKSLVDAFTEYDIVEVFNPLSRDFEGQVATSVVNPNAGVDKTIERMGLRNANHQSQSHVVNKVVIPSGQSKKMPGHVARVVVTQLVNELMQLEGAVKQMGDKTLRIAFEEKVIMDSAKFQQSEDIITAEERFQRQLNELNKTEELEVTQDEQPFAAQTTNPQPAPSTGKAGTGRSPATASKK